MAITSKIPRRCFAVPDWNGDVLIFDPGAPLTPSCRVIVYLRDDLRVRIIGTYVPEVTDHQTGTIRVRLGQAEEGSAYREFDREIVSVARVVRVDCKVESAKLEQDRF